MPQMSVEELFQALDRDGDGKIVIYMANHGLGIATMVTTTGKF